MTAWQEVVYVRHCFEAFNEALRDAEAASQARDLPRLAEAGHFASDLIDIVRDCIDPVPEKESDVEVLVELRARVRSACERRLPRDALH